MNEFSQRLKIALESAGMTQSELATRLEIKPQSVQKWCSGGGLPRAARLREIAKTLEASEAWLSAGHGEIRDKRMSGAQISPREWLHSVIDDSSDDVISVLERLISVSTGMTRKS